MAIFALPLYVTGPVGGNETGAGIAFGMFAVSALVLRPFAGRIADVYRPVAPARRRRYFSPAVSLALIALVEDLAAIIALRLLAGVAEAAFFVAELFAALADIAPAEPVWVRGVVVQAQARALSRRSRSGPTAVGEVLVEAWGFGPQPWVGRSSAGRARRGRVSLLIGGNA